MMILRRVAGKSMEPNLQPGQVVVARRARHLQTGQVVIIRHQGLEKIKRVATVDGGHVTVTGDNPSASTDSRHFGRLPRSTVIAKIVWPRI